MRILVLSYIVVFMVLSCDFDTKRNKETFDELPREVHSATREVEIAHGYSSFVGKDIYAFDIEMQFGSGPSRTMSVYVEPKGSHLRLEKPDGSKILWKDGTLFSSSDTSKWEGDQFAVFTYTYFAMLPYKLNDPGVNVKVIEPNALFKLTFDQGTGDSPDDWYTIHLDSQKHIGSAGYIVTYGGTDPDEAAKSAHAIHYTNYQNISGIPMATEWWFTNYNAESYKSTDTIGHAILSRQRFVDDLSIFNPDQDMHEVSL